METPTEEAPQFDASTRGMARIVHEVLGPDVIVVEETTGQIVSEIPSKAVSE